MAAIGIPKIMMTAAKPTMLSDMETSPALQLRVCCRIKLRGDPPEKFQFCSVELGIRRWTRVPDGQSAFDFAQGRLATLQVSHTSCGPTFFFAWHLETIAERRRVRRSSGSSES